MADNRFIPGVTDAGKPRAAKGGFPYPGHFTLAEVKHDERRRAKIQREHDKSRDYQRARRSRDVLENAVVDLHPKHDNWCATFKKEVA